MPGIINPLDPIGSQVEQMAIDRQRALAAALQQQSMTPADGQMVSGHYVAPSWAQFAAKLAQGLSGKSMNDDLDRKTVDYQRQAYAAALAANGGGQQAGSPSVALGQGAASGSIGPTIANALRMDALPKAASVRNPLGMDPQFATDLMFNDPKKYFELQAAAYKPTEATLTARQAGMDPQKANADALFKLTNVPPLDVKPGGTLYDTKEGKPIFNAPSADGNQFDYKSGSPTMGRVPGADATVAAAAAAELRGKNAETPAPKDMLPTLPDGTVIPRTVGQTIGHAAFPRAEPQTGSIVPGQSDRLAVLEQERAKETNPANIAALDRDIARERGAAPAAVGAKYGQKEGIEGQQTELVKKWEPLNAANQTAETATSYLQNIKGLAAKAATGPQSDKIALTNGLLSLVGNEKATDAVTANNLLDKYSNQIVARLGGGAMGTDAARSIIAAANPNSKMNLAAINEAVDNLVGANKLIQAKTALLAPHRNANDFKSYTEKEVTFDQAADPRIWQYASMPPAERAAFKAKLAQQGIAAEFGNKIRTLESLGVKF